MFLVVGDSVPLGHRTEALAWPHRVPPQVPSAGEESVSVHARTGIALAVLADDLRTAVERNAGEDSLTVLVHAGHNDAQLSGGEPRVTESRFRAAARDLDDFLSAHDAVDRHAFVGLVPLVPLAGSAGGPFSDAQPARSLAYDDLLAATVSTHVPLGESPEDWRELTVDGVHPNGEGHGVIADRVAAHLAGR